MPHRLRAAIDAKSPKDNRLLAALPQATYDLLLPHLEPAAMPLGMAVYESGGVQGYDHLDRGPALRAGERLLGGDRHHRQ